VDFRNLQNKLWSARVDEQHFRLETLNNQPPEIAKCFFPNEQVDFWIPQSKLWSARLDERRFGLETPNKSPLQKGQMLLSK
jgi:hypothetical protein